MQRAVGRAVVRNCKAAACIAQRRTLSSCASGRGHTIQTYHAHSNAAEPSRGSGTAVNALDTAPLNAAAAKDAWRQLPLPLHERAAQYTCMLTDLRAWHQQARRQARQTYDAFAADNGPTSDDLQREVEWVLEDAVAGAEHPPGSENWRDIGWRDLHLEPVERDAPPPQSQVLLRARLQDLQELWTARIQDRAPLQYLTNCAHWWRFTLAVGPGVLIPRPETEHLLGLIEQHLKGHAATAHASWADLGTGSGALALGLATLLPASSQVYAVDASPAAAAWAQLNCSRIAHSAPVQVAVGSWFEPLQHMRGQLSGIVSNPPYIPSGNMTTLQAEVGRHEPHSALDGGHGSGTDSLSEICTGAAAMLLTGGVLFLETNGGQQAHDIADALRATHSEGGQPVWKDAQVLKDQFDVDRFVFAERR